ncbi:MAG: ankyrin repeat domain-containing protein [Actinomycetota bacterium]|nr:ankyrin repeat domain-containing protein [Actinomycetota bacterium]
MRLPIWHSALMPNDRDGRSQLHNAAMRGDLEEVQRLLEVGSEVDGQDRRGFTPLHFAAQASHVAEKLLAAGASTNVRDAYGNTALWTATFNSRGHGDLINMLLAHGADPDSLNNSGASPRSLAETIGNYDVARFFKG